MRPIDGYELLKHVRANEILCTTPFFMMTTERQASFLVKAKQASLNHLIIKPFTPAALRELIESICGELQLQDIV